MLTPVLASFLLIFSIIVSLTIVFIIMWKIMTRNLTTEEKQKDEKILKESLLNPFVGGAFLTFILTFAIIVFPYNPKYWFMEKYEGTVSEISNQITDRFNKEANSFYLVQLEEHQAPFIVKDSRISNFDKGDKITFDCVNIWKYVGSDTKSCNIIY